MEIFTNTYYTLKEYYLFYLKIIKNIYDFKIQEVPFINNLIEK